MGIGDAWRRSYQADRLATILPEDQVQPLDFVTPGFRGLNTVQAASLMDSGFCTVAQNAVIDLNSRLAARNGVQPLSTKVTITFTAAPTGTSATLSAAWAYTTGVYVVTFDDNEVRLVTLTNGLTTATWYTALTGTPTATATTFLNIRQTITFTASPTGNGGNLTAAWTLATGSYTIMFSDGSTQVGDFTNGSIGVTWLVAMAGTLSPTAVIQMPVQSIFQYDQGSGVIQQILAWAGGISNSTSRPQDNLISGSVDVTDGRWFFQNFNNKCVGFRSGFKPIVYTGTGNFATVVESAGTAPSGGVGCAAFGRIWCVDSDLQTIKYSGLLDETDWSLTDGNAGLIDMHTIWADGTDEVTAIFPFNAALVVCGRKHIILFTDGRGSMLGMDPTQAYVFDILLGTGCLSQWTVAHVGEADVVFLSPNGVQSLQRLTTARNNPIETLSKYNHDELLAQVATESVSAISGAFSALNGFYLLSLPTSGQVWVFDQRRKFTDEVGELSSVTTTWTLSLSAMSVHPYSQVVYLAQTNSGGIGYYGGYDDNGSSYTWSYSSPWMNLGQQVSSRIKMLKRLSLLLFTSGGATFNAALGADFQAATLTIPQTIVNFGANSQYGIGQYGISQYGGGTNLYQWKYPAHIKGQYLQLSVSSQVTGAFAIQQAQFAAKIGRVA